MVRHFSRLSSTHTVSALLHQKWGEDRPEKQTICRPSEDKKPKTKMPYLRHGKRRHWMVPPRRGSAVINVKSHRGVFHVAKRGYRLMCPSRLSCFPLTAGDADRQFLLLHNPPPPPPSPSPAPPSKKFSTELKVTLRIISLSCLAVATTNETRVLGKSTKLWAIWILALYRITAQRRFLTSSFSESVHLRQKSTN